MAEQMGITGATLTHHLNMLENRGLVRRWRDADNRRVQHVELTDAGVELFDRLRVVAQSPRPAAALRSQRGEVERLGELLERLAAGVTTPYVGTPNPAWTRIGATWPARLGGSSSSANQRAARISPRSSVSCGWLSSARKQCIVLLVR